MDYDILFSVGLILFVFGFWAGFILKAWVCGDRRRKLRIDRGQADVRRLRV